MMQIRPTKIGKATDLYVQKKAHMFSELSSEDIKPLDIKPL
jgi:hypothetical protein